MRQTLRNFIFLSTFTLAGISARADIHEITPSLSIGTVLGHNNGMTLDTGDGTTMFALGASYYRLMYPNIQLGGTFDFISGGGSFYEALVGMRYNFGSQGWRNDFFINPSVGFAKTTRSDVSLMLDFGFGKRFSLLPNIAYSPTFSFYYIDGMRVRFDFIKFSVVF